MRAVKEATKPCGRSLRGGGCGAERVAQDAVMMSTGTILLLLPNEWESIKAGVKRLRKGNNVFVYLGDPGDGSALLSCLQFCATLFYRLML